MCTFTPSNSISHYLKVVFHPKYCVFVIASIVSVLILEGTFSLRFNPFYFTLDKTSKLILRLVFWIFKIFNSSREFRPNLV
jgi:hypothetical protein